MKIAYIECSWITGRPYVDVNYSLIAFYDATGQAAPVGNGTAVFGVVCEDAVAAQIEADANCLVHTDDNLFLPLDTAPETHWQNELEAWLNG